MAAPLQQVGIPTVYGRLLYGGSPRKGVCVDDCDPPFACVSWLPASRGCLMDALMVAEFGVAEAVTAAPGGVEADGDDSGRKRQRARSGKAVASASVAAPEFPPGSAVDAAGGCSEFRRVQVPPHRLTPLKKDWMQLYTPIVDHLKLDVRMNARLRAVELRTSAHTADVDVLQKAADFLRAYMCGFEVADAVALLRVEDLYVDSFQVTDVKILKGDHLSRAIGRIAGKDGKVKFAIENATRTRIVLAEQNVHILGSHAHTRAAKDAVCSLILGSPPSKVYANLRAVSTRLGQRL